MRQILQLEPNPFADWGAYAAADANRLILEDDRLIGFHVTTPEGAEKIFNDGPKAHNCPVGFNNRSFGSAFWLNCVPWIPYGIESSDPKFTSGVDMVVLKFVVPPSLRLKPHIEHTWPFTQWPVQTLDLIDLELVGDVKPKEFVAYRTAKSLKNLRGWIEESLAEEMIPRNGYVARIF